MKADLIFLGEQQSVEISKAHYLRRLGFPVDFEVPEHIQVMMDETVKWYRKEGNPWLEIFELQVKLDEDLFYLNGHPVKSEKILKRFKKYNVEKAMLIAATAGDRVDEETKSMWSEYPDKSFFLETYASSVTEALVEFAADQIRDWAEFKLEKSLSRYSPGYPGWDLKEQAVLMKIISEYKNDIPVQITETSLLKPLKSQLSLLGIYQGEQKEKKIEIECMQCTFNTCSCRKKEIYIKK